MILVRSFYLFVFLSLREEIQRGLFKHRKIRFYRQSPAAVTTVPLTIPIAQNSSSHMLFISLPKRSNIFLNKNLVHFFATKATLKVTASGLAVCSLTMVNAVQKLAEFRVNYL